MKKPISRNGLKTASKTPSKTELKPKSKSQIEFEILSHLEVEPNVSQRNLASEVGVSLGSVNYCLKALVEKGCKGRTFGKIQTKLDMLIS